MRDHMPSMTVAIGDASVVIKSNVRSSIVTANILGVDRDESGEVETVYLDRRVHYKNTTFHGWAASGAVSTVLHKIQLQKGET